MSFNRETKAFGSIRRYKGYGACGVILGLAALSIAMNTGVVSADEVKANEPKSEVSGEVKESTIKNETPTGNASTNLSEAAGSISENQKADLGSEGKVTGDVPVTIDHTEVQEEAKKAEEVGVNVVQDKTKVAPTTATAEDTAKAVKSISAEETKKAEELKSTATAHSTATSQWAEEKKSTVAFNHDLDQAHLKAVESYNDFIKTLDDDTAAVVARYKDAIIKVSEKIQDTADGTTIEGYQAYVRSLAEQQGLNKDAIKEYLVKKADYNQKLATYSETVVHNLSNSARIEAENKAKSQSVDAENTRLSTSAQKVIEDNTSKSNSVVAENNRLSTSAKTENERRSNSAKAVENDNIAKSNSVKDENDRRSNSAKAENKRRSNSAKAVENDNIFKSNSVIKENERRSNSAKEENEKRSNVAKQNLTNEHDRSLAADKENERRSNQAKAETERRSNSAKAENEKRSNAVKKVEDDNRTKSLSAKAENDKRSNSAKAETAKRSQSAVAENTRRSNSVKAENDKLSANYNSSMTAYRTAKAKYDKEKADYDRKLVEYNKQKVQGQVKGVKVVGNFDESKRGSTDYYSKLTAIFDPTIKDLEVVDGALGAGKSTRITLDKGFKHDANQDKGLYDRTKQSDKDYNGEVITNITKGAVLTVHNIGRTKSGKTISARLTSTSDAVPEHKIKGNPNTYARFNLWWQTSRLAQGTAPLGFDAYNYINPDFDIQYIDEATGKPLNLGLTSVYLDIDYQQSVRHTYGDKTTGIVVNPKGSLVKETTVRGQKYWEGIKTQGTWEYDDASGLNRYKKGSPIYTNVEDEKGVPEGSILSVGYGSNQHLSYLQNATWSLNPYSESASKNYKTWWNQWNADHGKPADNDFTIYQNGYTFYLWGGKSVVNILVPPTPPKEPTKPTPRRDDAKPATYTPATYTPVTFKPTTPPKYVPVTYKPATYEKVPYTPGTPIPYVPVTYEKVTYTSGNTDWKPVSYEKVGFTPGDTSWTPTGYTPVKFTPKNTDWNPVPYTPTPYVPEKLVEVPKEPQLDLTKLTAPRDPEFHKIPKEPKVPTVHYHLTSLNENTPVEKEVRNEEGADINNESVAKNSTNHFILKPKALPAGRPTTTSLVLSDYIAKGIELNIAGMQKANKSYDISYNDSTRLLEVKGTESEYAKANADRTVPYTPTAFTIIYKVLNDGATYENVFKFDINGGAEGKDPNGYTSYSNKVRIHTPGSPENPHDPENPSGKHNHKIQPVKNNRNKEGKNINGKELLQSDVNYYVAEWDLDQYIKDKSSKSAIAKGFAYIDNYQENAVTPLVKEYYAVTSKGEKLGKDVLDFYEADSTKLSELPERVQKLIKDSGIDVSKFGKFQIWVAKDSQAFYDKYVKTGTDIFFHMPMSVNIGFNGKYENQTYQIDFGNGYYGNVVKNNVPNLTPKKDVIVDSTSVDNQTINYGQEFDYLLKGAKLPSNRGSHLWEVRFLDDYDETGDKYLGYQAIASTNITVTTLEEVKSDTKATEEVTLEDGTVIKVGDVIRKGSKVRRTHTYKVGDDLTKFTESVLDEKNGVITVSFKEDFLKTVEDSSEFGADVKLHMKRIAYGEFENTYVNRINGVDYVSNTVKTNTPEPPKPEEPKKPQLPNTGETETAAASIAGYGLLALASLSLLGTAKRKDSEE
jgi:agglutinin receptor